MTGVDPILGGLGFLTFLGGSAVFGMALGRLLNRRADQATACCRCSHTFNAHQDDCAFCPCRKYRAALPVRVTGLCRCGLAFDDCPDPILHARR